MKKVLLMLLILFLCILISCSDKVSGTSETGNAFVAGHVVDSMNQPVSGLEIHLLPRNFNPLVDDFNAEGYRDTTDSNGVYDFAIPLNGIYTISGIDTAKGGFIAQDNILLKEVVLNLKDTVAGLQSAVVAIPKENAGDSGALYVHGTPFSNAGASDNNQISLPLLPKGPIPSVSFIDAVSLEVTPVTSANEIVIDDSVTYWGENVSWQYSTLIEINTSASGFNITENQLLFPFKLQLDNTFDFSQVDGLGTDIRFLDKSGEALTYEVASWDSTGEFAEVWILLDTIWGNMENQPIIMLWGNDSASSLSSGSDVFDTANGVIATWHFSPNDTFSDETALAHHGTNSGSVINSGSFGFGRAFDGVNDDNYIEVANKESFKLTKEITFTAWIKPTFAPEDWDGIFSYIHDNNLEESGFAFAYADTAWHFMVVTEGLAANQIRYFPGAKDVPIGSWSHLAGTYDGAMVRVYLNGVEVANQALTGNLDWEFDPIYARIGMFADSDEAHEFSGSLDEIQIHNVTRSADWIKLQYEHQKKFYQ